MSESAPSLAGVDRPTSVADLPPLVRIRCPDCGTETTVSSETAHDALETHDEKRHDGDRTAGLKIQTDDGFVIVPHPDDVVTDGGATSSDAEREVAHQVAVRETTPVGTKDSGRTSVTDIDIVPQSADVIHPNVADRLKDEFGVKFPHKYDLYVADECDIDTESEQSGTGGRSNA